MSLALDVEGASRADIAETLRLLNIDAKRCVGVVEPSTMKGAPTEWTIAHRRLNDALEIYELTP